MKFTLDSQLGTLLDHPQAKPIIKKIFLGYPQILWLEW